MMEQLIKLEAFVLRTFVYPVARKLGELTDNEATAEALIDEQEEAFEKFADRFDVEAP